VPLIENGCAAWLECRLIRERTPRTRTTPASPRSWRPPPTNAIFANGHWSFRDDNVELQTIHHLGGGNFVHAGQVRRAKIDD
jgi:hypothetical protein